MSEEITFDMIMFFPTEQTWNVRVSYRLPNGYQGTGQWEVDADDDEVLKTLAAHYEPKVMEKAAGQGQSFEPTGQVLGFEKE